VDGHSRPPWPGGVFGRKPKTRGAHHRGKWWDAALPPSPAEPPVACSLTTGGSAGEGGEGSWHRWSPSKQRTATNSGKRLNRNRRQTPSRHRRPYLGSPRWIPSVERRSFFQLGEKQPGADRRGGLRGPMDSDFLPVALGGTVR